MSNAPKTTPDEHLDPKAQAAHQDDVIVVPRGTKKVRFVMTFLIVVMVLTTFSISGIMQDTFSCQGRSVSAWASWRSADGTAHALSEREFVLERRRLQSILWFLFGTQEREPTDEQTAAFLVLDDAAERAGVRATDADVAKFSKDVFPFQSREHYQVFLQRFNLSGKEFDDLLRRAVRFKRYEALLAAATAVPDPAAVEKTWRAQHQEYACDYVELPCTSLEADARAQAPDDATLKAWFDALPETDKAAFKTKDAVSAELVALPLEGEVDAAKLFALYPRPQGEDAEAKAREFHAGFAHALYRREKMESGKAPWKDFDDVKDRALRDAPIYNSLMDWQKTVAERDQKGERVDLAAEASALGLSYRAQVEPLTADGWKALSLPWIDNRMQDQLFKPEQKEGFFSSIVPEAKGFVFGRVMHKEASRLQEFAEVKPAVLDLWARRKSTELSVAKLEALRDKLGTRPDPSDANAPPFKPEIDHDTFAKVVREAGLEPQRRDWAEKNPPPAPEGDSIAAQHFRAAQGVFSQRVGSVLKAELNRAGTTAFLVRLDGVRDPDLARITPFDLQQIGGQMAQLDRKAFVEVALVSKAALQQRFQLDLQVWHPRDEKQP